MIGDFKETFISDAIEAPEVVEGTEKRNEVSVPSLDEFKDKLEKIFKIERLEGLESTFAKEDISEKNPMENENHQIVILDDGTVVTIPDVEIYDKDKFHIESIFVEKLDIKSNFENSSFLPENHGEWSGEVGNSKWLPDHKYTPPEKSRNPEKPYSNPDNLTWKELMDKYGIDGIEFRDGYPVFDEVARGTVEIDDFTDDRISNFAQANEKMAEQRGCTPEEVETWMEENNYTWHECQDCKTMQKVPNEIHANVPHEGGVSVYKSKHNN